MDGFDSLTCIKKKKDVVEKPSLADWVPAQASRREVYCIIRKQYTADSLKEPIWSNIPCDSHCLEDKMHKANCSLTFCGSVALEARKESVPLAQAPSAACSLSWATDEGCVAFDYVAQVSPADL